MKMIKKLFNPLKLLFKVLLISMISNSYGFEGTLSYERFARLNNPQQKTQSTDWFGLSLDSKKFGPNYEAYFELDLRYFNSADEGAFNFSLPEAYFQYKTPRSHTSFGRKRLDWTPREKFWQIGYLNAQRGFRLLDDKQEGLTGIHYDFRPNQIGPRFSLFFSYFHIPTLNPSVNIKDGEITGNSEWQKLPPKQTVISGSPVPIYYELNDPSISDIVLKKSLGLNLEYSWGSGKVQGYTIYKPESGLRVNAEAYYSLENDRVEAIANPIVNHHMMPGFSIHQRLYGVLFTTGADFIDPNARLGKDFDVLSPSQMRENNKKFESEFFTIEPNYERESYGYFRASIDQFYYHFSLNYIHRLNNDDRKGDDFFSDTVKFKRAVGFDVGFWPTEKLYLTIDWKYDLAREDNILKFESLYQFVENTTVGLGGELMSAPDDSSYWSPYRTNDTIYGVFNYHF